MRISDWSSDVCSSDLSFGTAVFITIFAAFVFFAPDFFGEAENYIEANPLKTPAHIVPEWYFLPFYAILRSIDFDIWFIPAKLGGLIAVFGSILVLRSEETTSELQSLMRSSYAVFSLKKPKRAICDGDNNTVDHTTVDQSQL